MAYSHNAPTSGGWTTADLDTLDEDGIRRELVNGDLIELPPPSRAHQKVTMRMMAALDDGCPPPYDVIPAVELRFDSRNSRCPDVLVAHADAVATDPPHYRASEVLLVVEVVSPATAFHDRHVKPMQYAEAGIPFYWRIELEPHLTAMTFSLDAQLGGYVLDDQFTDRITVDFPWEIDIGFDTFVPRKAKP